MHSSYVTLHIYCECKSLLTTIRSSNQRPQQMLAEKVMKPLKMASLSNFICHGLLLPILLLLLKFSAQHAKCGNIVKYLPGFEGPLPFVLETGYIGVGENEDVQAFYYFIESENNPKVDPLMLWLTGGPGCSAFSGLVFEIGPITFKIEEYNGSLPNLVLRPHSWTKVSSIIFVDLPVNTGFSYATTESASHRTDWSLVHQTHQFLRKWLIEHPEFFSNEVYIGGDSYSGIPVPVITHEISQANEEGIQPWINLQGYLLGNAATTRTEKNQEIPFAHGMGLISDELYQSLQKNCRGEYANVDIANLLCAQDLKSYEDTISGLCKAHILEPNCELGSPKPVDLPWKRSLIDNYYSWSNNNRLALPPLTCRSYGYFLSSYWANDGEVRSALNIHKGTKAKWQRCTFDIPHKEDIPSSFPYHVKLSKKGYRSLIYSGDHDMMIPFLATEAWIRSLNYSIIDDWRPWHTNGQVAGYSPDYSYVTKLNFVTMI
ncbi:hypothetical protein Ahy_A10g051294 isoform A [Arachis hypogaea]|uniref:Serine carboxypeptidase-like n=1 Tax=Arachis hypogaea TaxID=3818 RepID=A0A445BCA3_ARAHY|nr:hypothetical protein Ahy_A10g051294 isoform A [Arachis hypogaea]